MTFVRSPDTKTTTGLVEMDPNARKRKHEDVDSGDVALKDADIDVGGKQQQPALDGSPQKNRVTSTSKKARMSSSSNGSPDSTTPAQSTNQSPSLNPTPPDASLSQDDAPPASNQAHSSPRSRSSLVPDAPDSAPSTAAAPTASATSTSLAASNPTSTSTSFNQQVKRKRLTAAEKKTQEEEKEKKRLQREQKKKEAAEKKAKSDAEKQARAQEKETKRQKKEEEERKIQEEKAKKEKSQSRLMSFFNSTTTTTQTTSNDKDKDSTPAPVTDHNATATNDSPSKKKQNDPDGTTPYNKLFKPFFVKSSVRIATNPFEMSQEAQEAKSRILDDYIYEQRDLPETQTFNTVEMLNLPAPPKPRGIIHEPVGTTVRHIQGEMEVAQKKGDLKKQAVLQNKLQQKLARVPVKTICFQQDVRPPYRGTVTAKQHEVGAQGMRKLARRPTSPVIKSLLYGYDSEAEWQDDEGEDIDLDDDEDDDLDDDDGLAADLIDDSEAVDLTRFATTGLEPQSTGLCWEDNQRCQAATVGVGRSSSGSRMRSHGMEFIFGARIQRNLGIDPFSTAYWEPPEKKRKQAAGPKKQSATNGFQQTENGSAVAAAAESDKTKGKSGANTNGVALPAGLSGDDLVRIKKAIRHNFETTPRISKLGMLEYLKSSALDGVKVNGKDISRNDVRAVLDVVALRKMKGGEVIWSLKPGHELGA